MEKQENHLIFAPRGLKKRPELSPFYQVPIFSAIRIYSAPPVGDFSSAVTRNVDVHSTRHIGNR